MATQLQTCRISQLRSCKFSIANSITHDQWPNQQMLGKFLFHKLRTVRRLERVIDEIKRSSDDSPLRDFDFLRSRLQEFLVEEREDANARSLNNP